jgi:hypothetical protein
MEELREDMCYYVYAVSIYLTECGDVELLWAMLRQQGRR